MPIYPRYDGSVNVATPDTPLAPKDLRGEQIAQAGQALQQAGQQGMAIRRKVKDLEDDTAAFERFMQADTEMQNEQEKYKGAEAEGAKGKFTSFASSRRSEWYKGLSPEASTKLDRMLQPKTLDYTSTAAKIENRYKLDKAGAVLVTSERNLTTAINRGRIVGDPLDSDEYKKHAKALDDYAALGLRSKEEAEKQKVRVGQNAAYDSAYRLVIDAPETFLKVNDSFEKDPKDPNADGYFLRNVPAKERAQLKGQAEERIRVKRNEEYTIRERARTEMERKDKEVREGVEIEMEKRLSGEGGPLTLQDVSLYESLRGVTGEKARFYRQAVLENLREGGPGDADTIRSVGLRVKSIDNAPGNNDTVRSLKSEVMQKTIEKKIPLKLGLEWIKGLDERENSESNPIRRQTNDVKTLIRESLQVEGPGSAIVNARTQPILEEALETIIRNEHSSNPRPPLEVYAEMKATWQARALVPAQRAIQSVARDHGIQYRSDQGVEQFADAKAKIKEQYNTTPPGRERDKIYERGRRLQEIENLQRQLDQRRPTGGAATQSPSGSQGAKTSGPITGPKENK